VRLDSGLTVRNADANAPAAELAGLDAARFFLAFANDPVSAGLSYQRRLGSSILLRPPWSFGARARVYLVTAKKHVAKQVLDDPNRFRTVGIALTRGPKNSSQRRLRNGVVRMNGHEQQALRRTYAPPLSKRNLSAFQTTLQRICAEEIEQWPRGQLFDAFLRSLKVAHRAAAEILFGARENPLADAIAGQIWRHSQKQFQLSAYLFPVSLPGTPYARLLKHAEETEANLIRWMKTPDITSNSLVRRIADMDDFDGQTIDDFGRAAQLWTLFGASFETTATALRWTLLHIAWNRAVQETLSVEIGEHGYKSAYLDAILLESLRLSTPGPHQMRRVRNVAQLDGQSLKRNDHVVINAAAINLDENYYSEPKQFKPERWLEMTPDPMTPLSFSAGPRRCLGVHFAMMVLKTFLVELFSTARIVVPDDAEINTKFANTQGPSSLPITLVPRTTRTRSARFSGRASLQMSEA
jgi:cytochrome P450